MKNSYLLTATKMRIPLVAGNWKMNKTNVEAKELASTVKEKLADIMGVKIVLCPPFTALSTIHSALKGTNLLLGAQNLHWEKEGAYTGEVSAKMLVSSGCKYVIVGHSERRSYFGESDGIIGLKLKAALSEGLFPILCVGEILQERERNETEKVLEKQLHGCLNGLSSEQMESITVAYEPVWAIGTGKNATPEQAQQAQAFIREFLTKKFGEELAQQINIIYGGSVTPENSKGLLVMPEIDGALVGGASLNPDSFEKIVKTAQESKKQPVKI